MVKDIQLSNKTLPTWQYEDICIKKGYCRIAGIDEAGRGPLAGPVVAAAVILNKEAEISGIKDSKKISAKKRKLLYDEIINSAISVGIGIIDVNIIDSINIKNATHLAMIKAVENMKLEPDFLLIDAEKLDKIDIPQYSIIKGDNLSISIAAASIIAKVERDEILNSFETLYPGYGFAQHKGYGTKAHYENIKKYGLLPIHRKTFTRNI